MLPGKALADKIFDLGVHQTEKPRLPMVNAPMKRAGASGQPSLSYRIRPYRMPITILTMNSTTGMVTQTMPMKSIYTPVFIIFVIGI